MQWELREIKPVLKTVPFTVEEVHLRDLQKEGYPKHPYHRLNCPDWVNILPITTSGQAILIRQSRAGCLKEVLEIPGGAIDANEKDATMAAARELEEETGYVSQRFLPLANINPNPALNNNRLFMFLALGCQLPMERKHFPDAAESIQIELWDVGKLDELIRCGLLDSCLSALTVMLAERYLKITPPR